MKTLQAFFVLILLLGAAAWQKSYQEFKTGTRHLHHSERLDNVPYKLQRKFARRDSTKKSITVSETYSDGAADRLEYITDVQNDAMDRQDRSSLPSLDDFISKLSELGTSYKFFECTVSVAKEGSKTSFDAEGCSLGLSQLLEYFSKNANIDLGKASYGLIVSSIMEVKKFSIVSKEINFECVVRPKETIKLFDNKLIVEKVGLSLSFNLHEKFAFGQLYAQVKGVIKIKGKEVEFSALKPKYRTEVRFNATTDKVEASDFRELFYQTGIVGNDAPENMNELAKVAIVDPVIKGRIRKNGAYEAITKGALNLGTLGTVKIYVIVKQASMKPLAAAVVVDIKEIDIARIFSYLNLNVAYFPIIKRSKVNVTLELANNNVVDIIDKSLRKLLAEGMGNAETIEKGLRAKINYADEAEIMVKISKRKLELKFNGELSLTDILKKFGEKSEHVRKFAHIFDGEPKVVIKSLYVKSGTKLFNISAELKDIVVKGYSLKLQSAHFKLSRDEENQLTYGINAKLLFGTSVIDINITKEGPTDYKLHGRVGRINATQIERNFSGDVVPGRSFFANLMDFRIKDVELEASLGKKTTTMSVKGEVSFFERNTSFEAQFVKKNNTWKTVLGIVVENIGLDRILEDLFSKKNVNFVWLSDVKAGVIISNCDDPVQLKSEQLKSLQGKTKLEKGILLGATVTIPKDCKDDDLCKQIQGVLGNDSRLYLQATFQKDTFRLQASYNGNKTLGNEFTLTDIHLVVEVGKKTEIFLEVEVHMVVRAAETDVSFKGKIGIGGDGKVELTLKLIGTWNQPFGLKSVSISNATFGLGFSVKKWMPSFVVAGVLHIGVKNNERFRGELDMSFDVINPEEAHFYARITPLTVKDVAEAFGFNTDKLPADVSNSGFPQGLVVGYTAKETGVQLTAIDLHLKQGFYLKGAIRIFDLDVFCELQLHTDKILIHIDVAPIHIAKGLIALRGSKDKPDSCFVIYALISRQEVAVKINAYAELLGIGAGVNMTLSQSGLYFHLVGKIFNLLEANFTVSATSLNILKGDFKVSACLASVQSKIEDAAEAEVEDGVTFAQKKVAEEEQKLNETETWLNNSKNTLTQARMNLKKKEEELRAEGEKLRQASENVRDDCTKKCGKVCVGGPGWNSKCGWFGCPTWIPCKWQVADIICIAKCKVKQIYEAMKGAFKKLLLQFHAATLKILNELLKLAEGFVEIAAGVYQSVLQAAEKIKEIVKVGLEAVKYIARGKFFSVKSVCLEASLDEAKDACFNFNATIIFLSTEMSFHQSVCLVATLRKLGNAIAEFFLPGITTLKTKVQESDESRKDFSSIKETMKVQGQDMKNKENELKKTEKDFENEMEMRQKPDEGDIDEVPSQRDAEYNREPMMNTSYYQNLMYEPLPSYTIRDDVTLEQFHKYSPWAYCERDDPFSEMRFKNVSGDDDTQDADERSSQYGNLDLSTKGCLKSQALVNNYQMLADSARFMVQENTKVRASYLKEVDQMKRNFAETSEALHRISSKGKFNDAQKEDAYFYLEEIEKGNRRWINGVAKQIHQQDEMSLTRLRKTMGKTMAKRYGLHLKDYVKKLKSTAEAAGKRSQFDKSATYESARLLKAAKAAGRLLSGGNAGITSYEDAIRELEEETEYLKSSAFTVCKGKD